MRARLHRLIARHADGLLICFIGAAQGALIVAALVLGVRA